MTTLPNDSGYDIVLRQERVAAGLVWTAVHPGLVGCTATGRTPTEAMENLAKSRVAWMEAGVHIGEPTPEPKRSSRIAVQYAPYPGATEAKGYGSDVHNTLAETLVTS